MHQYCIFCLEAILKKGPGEWDNEKQMCSDLKCNKVDSGHWKTTLQYFWEPQELEDFSYMNEQLQVWHVSSSLQQTFFFFMNCFHIYYRMIVSLFTVGVCLEFSIQSRKSWNAFKMETSHPRSAWTLWQIGFWKW